MDERSKVTLAILPDEYPNQVVTDQIKNELDLLITTKYKARLIGQSDIRINIQGTKVASGLMTIECGDSTSADWIAFNIPRHGWGKFNGLQMTV